MFEAADEAFMGNGEVTWVTSNNVRLAVHVYGVDGPLIILLHGFPDTSASMAPLARLLCSRGAVVAVPALRGYPPTGPAPDGRYDLDALVEDILGLVEGLGYGQAILVGHDWGAVIAYASAARGDVC